MTPVSDEALRRVPQLSADGQFYCSANCGGGKYCRKEWYDRAVTEANAMVAHLGDGWEAVTWENLGWYSKAKKGCVTVYADLIGDGTKRYSAWIEPDVLVGSNRLQIIARGDTPEDALGFAIQDARTVMSRMNDALAVLNDVAESRP